MEKSAKKIVDHLIKHQFLSPSFNKFALLGNLVKCNLRYEWFHKNVTTNNAALVLDNQMSPMPVDENLLQNLNNARSLFGFDQSITFASSCVRSPEEALVSEDKIADVGDIVNAMTQTYLNLHVFSLPAHKSDNFSLLQKKRRHWWKSIMKQPETLLMNNLASSDPGVEQRLEIVSTKMESTPVEVITLWKPDVFEDLKLGETLKSSTMVKFQRTLHWPCLITSQLMMETAACLFLMDSCTMRKKSICLSLHHTLSPFKVAIMINGQPTKTTELQELRQLLSQQLHQGGVSVLPSGAPWTAAQCDSRAVPFTIHLDEYTLENGICGLRNRDTSLTVQIHVSEVIEKLKSICRI